MKHGFENEDYFHPCDKCGTDVLIDGQVYPPPSPCICKRCRSERGQAVASAGMICITILVLVAVAIIYGCTNFADASAKVGTVLQSLPLTDHAMQKTLTNIWNVANVTVWMEGGNCKPLIVYSCPGGITKYICPMDPTKIGPKDLYAGIIVGNKTPNGSDIVITGFFAPLKTWERLGKRDGCVSNTMPLDWIMP